MIEGIDGERLRRGEYEAEWAQAVIDGPSVPDFAFNILNLHGLLYRPIADEMYLKEGNARPRWPEDKPFAVCLTHDVDAVALNFGQEFFRGIRENFPGGGLSPVKMAAALKMGMAAVCGNRRAEPKSLFEPWLEAERAAGARSTFFFWPGKQSILKRHVTDCLYQLSDTVRRGKSRSSVADVMRDLARQGWEIGLHPSWNSAGDLQEMKNQKDSLEKVLGHAVVSVRQHCLRYHIARTPRIQNEAGFRFDSTLGFNDNVGFRFGTSYPWAIYDLEKKQELPLLEIPLVIQDSALLNPRKGLRLDPETAMLYITNLASAVETTGGVLTLSWHPNWRSGGEWWDLYKRVLEYLKGKNAWFAPVKEVGEWWLGQRAS